MEVAVAFDKKQSIQKCMITMGAAQCKASMVHQFSMGFNAMKVSEISYGELLKGPIGHNFLFSKLSHLYFGVRCRSNRHRQTTWKK